MSDTIMNAMDAVYGSLAECYITIDGSRYNMMSLTEFNSELAVNITEVPILGKVGMGHKPAGGKGTWSGTAHYNQSVLRRMADQYQKTGVLPYFEIQVTNEDPSSSVGAQTTACVRSSPWPSSRQGKKFWTKNSAGPLNPGICPGSLIPWTGCSKRE